MVGIRMEGDDSIEQIKIEVVTCEYVIMLVVAMG